jgi:hypothetical protein
MLPNSLRFFEEAHPELDPNLMFVAMPFDKAFDTRYEHIYKTRLESEGFQVREQTRFMPFSLSWRQ